MDIANLTSILIHPLSSLKKRTTCKLLVRPRRWLNRVCFCMRKQKSRASTRVLGNSLRQSCSLDICRFIRSQNTGTRDCDTRIACSAARAIAIGTRISSDFGKTHFTEFTFEVLSSEVCSSWLWKFPNFRILILMRQKSQTCLTMTVEKRGKTMTSRMFQWSTVSSPCSLTFSTGESQSNSWVSSERNAIGIFSRRGEDAFQYDMRPTFCMHVNTIRILRCHWIWRDISDESRRGVSSRFEDLWRQIHKSIAKLQYDFWCESTEIVKPEGTSIDSRVSLR